MERIEKLETLIPKFKSNKKISPLKIEAMEWELRALRAEQQLKILNIPVVMKSVCTCKNAETEKNSSIPVFCHNCNAYVQTVL